MSTWNTETGCLNDLVDCEMREYAFTENIRSSRVPSQYSQFPLLMQLSLQRISKAKCVSHFECTTMVYGKTVELLEIKQIIGRLDLFETTHFVNE